MDWRLRLVGEKILDFIPYSHKIHQLFEESGTKECLDSIRGEYVQRKLEHWRYLYENVPINLKDKKVVEIGTGWSGIDLFFFHLLGAAEVHTVDILPHLNLRDCHASLEGLETVADEIENFSGISNIRGLLKRIPMNSLSDCLKYLNVHYHVGKELSDLKLEKESIDLFYSYSSLGHVPLPQLRRTFATAKNIVKKEGILCNNVRFIDIFYPRDGCSNPLGYLSYSEWLWEIMQSRKFNYQNRIRHVEFLNLMKESGFELIKEKTVPVEDAETFINLVKLDKRFTSIEVEDFKIAFAAMIHRPGSE